MGFEALVPFAVLLLPFIWIVCGAASGYCTEEKQGGRCLGWVLGFALGPVGLIIALLMPYKPKE